MGRHDSACNRWEQSAVDFVTFYQRIPVDQRTESIDGGWSVRQILEHLLEDEILFATRMRAAIVEPGSADDRTPSVRPRRLALLGDRYAHGSAIGRPETGVSGDPAGELPTAPFAQWPGLLSGPDRR